MFPIPIDDTNLSWIQAVNIPKILQNGDTYLHVAAKFGNPEIFEMILETEEVKNPKNDEENTWDGRIGGTTPFHLACHYGHLRIVKMLLERSDELNIGKGASTKDIGSLGRWVGFQKSDIAVLNLTLQ